MSVIYWRSGVPIEGEHPAISEPVIGQVPQSAKLFGAAIGKGKEVGGGRQNVKVQMPKGKIQITDDGFRTTSTKLTDTDTKVGAKGQECSFPKTYLIVGSISYRVINLEHKESYLTY
jgi:hypothetical protein